LIVAGLKSSARYKKMAKQKSTFFSQALFCLAKVGYLCASMIVQLLSKRLAMEETKAEGYNDGYNDGFNAGFDAAKKWLVENFSELIEKFDAGEI
jgi:hypothetical protein